MKEAKVECRIAPSEGEQVQLATHPVSKVCPRRFSEGFHFVIFAFCSSCGMCTEGRSLGLFYRRSVCFRELHARVRTGHLPRYPPSFTVCRWRYHSRSYLSGI
ncbi:unnamed protein product [Scytosiphon promiscuus]